MGIWAYTALISLLCLRPRHPLFCRRAPRAAPQGCGHGRAGGEPPLVGFYIRPPMSPASSPSLLSPYPPRCASRPRAWGRWRRAPPFVYAIPLRHSFTSFIYVIRLRHACIRPVTLTFVAARAVRAALPALRLRRRALRDASSLARARASPCTPPPLPPGRGLGCRGGGPPGRDYACG